LKILTADLKKFNDWYKYTDNNKIVVDKVFRYESLDEELTKSPIPYNNELSTVFVKSNTREQQGFSHLYTKEMEEKVVNEFKLVLDTFGYQL
jgi:hypothetical protein